MSGSTQNSAPLQKHKDANVSDSKDASQPQKPAAQLEEDDEFEDFPIEDWAKEEEVGAQANNTHLWEESWDDDDTSDDFSVQLKEELKKMESRK
ncbi:26S proteasome complex subunit [Meristemomyces frigidus]|nr:26S proteasome complex subunit [Meristemomyces frigidus]